MDQYTISPPAKTLVNCPNAGEDNFTLQTSSPVLEFMLFNSLGENMLMLIKPDQEFTIPTHDLSPGLYFWMIKYQDSRIETGKWIKR